MTMYVSRNPSFSGEFAKTGVRKAFRSRIMAQAVLEVFMGSASDEDPQKTAQIVQDRSALERLGHDAERPGLCAHDSP